MSTFFSSLSSSFSSPTPSLSPTPIAPPVTGGHPGVAGVPIKPPSTFDWKQAVSGGLNFMSAGMSFQAGELQAQSRRSQAEWSNLQGSQETLNAQERANLIREDLLATLDAQTVAYSASGIELSSGAPLAVAQRSKSKGATAIRAEERVGRIRMLSHRQQARQLMQDAENASYGGKAQAFGQIAQYAIGAFNRG